MRTIRIFTASILTILTFLTSSLAGDTSRHVVRTENSDYFGFDLRAEKNVTLDQCEAICIADKQCRAFTYNLSAQWCFLKADYSRLDPYQGAVAGRIIEATAEPDIGAPPALQFVPGYIADEARQLAAKISTRKGPLPDGLNTLVRAAQNSLSAGDTRRAMGLYGASLKVAPDHAESWAGMARATLLTEPANSDENYQLPQHATSAAFNAYQYSRTVNLRAEALALLATALERRSLSRPALEAFKASLTLVNSAAVRAEYADLHARKGFRVIDHTVDSDSSTPRICIQFSESLIKTGLDYTPFVTVDGSAPDAVEAKDQQICVEGLNHSQRYHIALRNGLPSEVGEVLEQPVALNVYVRDRSPTARFTGENFVLPSTARRGIPLVTVNSESASLQLYRVGARAMTQLLTGSQFLRQLDGYSASQIADDLGVAIWEGTLDIDTELNKDIVTNIPVDELVPDMKPGVYVLTARPKGDQRNSWETQATQWFVVSDIGLTTYAGEDGLHVFTRALSSAGPMAGVELKLLARNNEILGTAVTDETGHTVFTAGLTRGENAMAPAIVLANGAQGDFVFLDMTRAGFDLSDRGVTGRPAPGALDVYTWTERGIYRAGETVHVGALARDTSANAVGNLPLTFIFKRPDGVEDRRVISNGAALGGHAVDLTLQDNSMRGTWQVRVYTDPKAEPVAEQMFLVEDFVPDRIEFDLETAVKRVAVHEAAQVNVDGRYLYGAPAAGLALEGEVNLISTRTWDGFDGYVFGLADEEKAASRLTLDNLPILDAEGKTAFDVRIDDIPSTTQLLNANVTVRLRESGGRAVERELDIPVSSSGVVLGIRPDFDGGQVTEGATATFDVIALDPAGNRQAATGLRWSLVKVERQYQWYRSGAAWNYEPVTYTSQVADGTIDTAVQDSGEISVRTDWGRYRLEVETAQAGGPITSIEFNAGWYVEAASTETPDGLEIALDQASYKPGDTARLTIAPRFAGELLIAIGADRLLATKMVSVPQSGTTIDIPVGDNWGAGAYVTATLFRPGNAQESRMPMRAIGIKWLQIDSGPHKLEVSLDLPDKTLPRQPFEI
ncbi:MAG: alpha-2-macroglobulin family protein, partial [Fimbriimonadaceae bacterium]|nr:alpha-2-macroglobulin family protein [Alphaproteobacteria bacterium]